MKRFTSTIIAVLALVTFAGVASAHPQSRRVDAREDRQHVRIADGMRRGDLTRGEARRLHRGQIRVHRMERRMKADGKFGMRERMRMERMQDRQSGRIYRMRHNGRTT